MDARESVMITAMVAVEPSLAGSTDFSDYRLRTAAAERPMLQDSTPSAPGNSSASNDGQFGQSDRQTPPQPEPVRRDPASMFAAAGIAGALPPTPTTMGELMQRIGISTIPEESEARLKDLLA